MKKAALYIRVSTDAQFEEGYSVDAQKEMLQSYCKSKGIKKYDFYIDGGFTGSNIERPEMHRMIEDVKRGGISHVIVYKLDRLSRSQKDTLYLIEDVFNPHQTDFVSLNENMDTSTPIGRAMLGIMSAFAQLERETIRERTRMGMKERVKSGLWMGGGRVPFGYEYDRAKGILVPNQDAETVRKIYDLYLQGYSADRIAKMVGLKYDRLAMQILTRKTNTGAICYNGEEYAGQHEAIVSLETYQKAMDMMKERSVKKAASSQYLLTGLLYCGKCGAKMRYQKWGKYGVKFVCYSQQKSKKYLVKDPDCDNEKVWADSVEEIVVKDLFRMALEKTNAERQGDSVSALTLLEQQYSFCSGKIKRLYNLYAESTDELLLQTIEENQKELAHLKQQIQLEKERNTLQEKMLETKKLISNIKEAWDYMTLQEKQSLIRCLIDKIELRDGSVSIHYKLLG